MKVHLNQIPEGSTLHLEGSCDAAPLGLGEAGAEPASPLAWSLDVGRSGSGIFATGSVSVDVAMECVVCLRRFTRTILVDPFATQIEIHGGGAIDLTPAIREDIHLALPSHPRCDFDGRNRCPASTDRPQARRHNGSAAWDALEQLTSTKTKHHGSS